jgi:hypothetical protein
MNYKSAQMTRAKFRTVEIRLCGAGAFQNENSEIRCIVRSDFGVFRESPFALAGRSGGGFDPANGVTDELVEVF